MKKKGTLFFHDTGNKFSSAKHGITNLLADCDICIYSLAATGDAEPSRLVIKVMKAGCMDGYLDASATDFAKHCVVMEMQDYKKRSPKNLFRNVMDLTYLLANNLEKKVTARFYEKNGLLADTRTANEFFSMEVDPNTDDPGVEIYLRDKVFFIK